MANDASIPTIFYKTDYVNKDDLLLLVKRAANN